MSHFYVLSSVNSLDVRVIRDNSFFMDLKANICCIFLKVQTICLVLVLVQSYTTISWRFIFPIIALLSRHHLYAFSSASGSCQSSVASRLLDSASHSIGKPERATTAFLFPLHFHHFTISVFSIFSFKVGSRCS